MKKLFRPLCLFLSLCVVGSAAHSQTKVFKEVAEDISTQFKTIIQDGKLVGYLAFTQLEQASADSFNYKLSIMDENLNDIGVVNFREQRIELSSVSFEQDVLCLAYLKSTFNGVRFKNKKEHKDLLANAKSYLFTQLVSLQGKIVASNNLELNIAPKEDYAYSGYSAYNSMKGELKHGIQLRNIPGKGFICFYGDDRKNNMVAYDPAGQIMWQKTVEDKADDFGLLASGDEINLLERKNVGGGVEGGYELASFSAEDGKAFPKLVPTDRKGNRLKVLSFDNDPVTGKPYLSGMIINPRDCPHGGTAKGLHHGIYSGVFTINVKGHTKKDVEGVFTYWDDESNPAISKKGYFREAKAYANMEQSFRDYQGNTYFAACGIYPRVKPGAIAGFILLSWTIIVPPLIAASGFTGFRSENVLVFKQDAKGTLTLENKLPSTIGSKTLPKSFPLSYYDPRYYYQVTNPETKTDYLVVTDPKQVDIYNIQQKKVARTIARKEGKNSFTVWPAKEGYYMVSEYNKKEKTTRLSIEAL